MPSRICVLGSANIDLTFRCAQLPVPGQTIIGESFYQYFGGKGANQAVAAARLGSQVSFIGKVGNDLYGSAIRDQLRREGIDTTYLFEDANAPTGTAAILVEESSQNSIVVVPGANGNLLPGDVKKAKEEICASQMLIAQLETPIPTIQEAFKIAKFGQVLNILNPAPAQELPSDLLKMVDICIPNETELQLLTGMPIDTLEQVEEAAKALRNRGPKEIIVTLGGRGVLMFDAFGICYLPGIPVMPIDSSGAGDAFIGAFAVYLSQGLPIREAARRANRVAAISVTKSGTQPSFPTQAEVDANP
jgi:ribokinase